MMRLAPNPNPHWSLNIHVGGHDEARHAGDQSKSFHHIQRVFDVRPSIELGTYKDIPPSVHHTFVEVGAQVGAHKSRRS